MDVGVAGQSLNPEAAFTRQFLPDIESGPRKRPVKMIAKMIRETGYGGNEATGKNGVAFLLCFNPFLTKRSYSPGPVGC